MRRWHKRHSVRALLGGALVQAAAGAWSAVPGALIDEWPRWVPYTVTGAIFAYGLWAALREGD
jgi:hypothetical protein